MNTIGEKIKIARESAGLSQRELAEMCEFEAGQGRIGNYERGVRSPSVQDLQIIAKAVSRSMSWFFDEDSNGLITDIALMRHVIEMILEVEQEEGCKFTPTQKARMAIALYNDSIRRHRSATDLHMNDLLPILEAVN
ncbi:hypothetical protein GCM10011348_46190 [Marinobacterium nitratireducens]|uniref:HTH cro/C1-type domain-containing protein n=1 Tax=Marinobacterium nitratireducens TaxID=518897 RepID=A0A918DXF0_9GAMM|nr:helix-turn-helix transcriptional regulator [Marinobacterium nitratireducens]GGO89139.1 hypothetical protein GCM10011348_46190 [Marinobacterium nitratireducens]